MYYSVVLNFRVVNGVVYFLVVIQDIDFYRIKNCCIIGVCSLLLDFINALI